MKTVAALCLLLLPQQAPETLTLTEKDGETCTARVLELKDGEARLAVDLLGGHLLVTRKLEDFTPASRFAIERAANPPHDFATHFAMAKRAAEFGLITEAGVDARAALTAVPATPEGDAQRQEVRSWGAGALQRLLEQAVADGRLAMAQHCLKLLSTRLADELSDAQLDALAKRVESLEAAQQQEREAARQARLEALVRERIERRLRPIQERIDDADRLQREAIRRSKTTVAATRLCERAVDAYQKAFVDLEKLLRDHPDDAELARSAETMGRHVHDFTIRAHLFAANMATVQSDYKNAVEWATKALELDPENAEAKEMLRTIQVAQAAAGNVWRWGWGWQPPAAPRARNF